MKYGKKKYLSMFWLALGVILIGCAFVGFIDQFWNGFGSGLVGVAVLQIIRQMRYSSDEEYREKVDIEVNDERNKYLTMKAWGWAGYLYIMIMAITTIVSKILGYDEITKVASFSLCILMVLYWISYLVLRKKY